MKKRMNYGRYLHDPIKNEIYFNLIWVNCYPYSDVSGDLSDYSPRILGDERDSKGSIWDKLAKWMS